MLGLALLQKQEYAEGVKALERVRSAFGLAYSYLEHWENFSYCAAFQFMIMIEEENGGPSNSQYLTWKYIYLVKLWKSCITHSKKLNTTEDTLEWLRFSWSYCESCII